MNEPVQKREMPPPPPGQKKGMSTGAKVGIGCGVGCLVIVIGIIIAGYVGYRFVLGKVDEFTAEFKQLGFENQVKGQVVEITEEINEKTVYIGQSVRILGDSRADIAIIAQMAEIHGRVEGKVYFRGQMIAIQPNAELLNGLDVYAQMVTNEGRIDGGITGQYQAIDGEGARPE